MRFRWLLIISLVVAACGPVLASLEVNAREYAALRTKNTASGALGEAKANAAGYVGKVIEVRGKIVGLSGRADGSSIIISTPNDGSYIIDSEELPAGNPGGELACLVRVGEGSVHSLSELRLVAYCYEADLKRLEDAWAQDAVSRAARQRANVEPVSRSGAPRTQASRRTQASASSVSVEEITRLYKNAIKGFNSKLTDKQADTIARSVLGFSAKYKLDPRLVCAVILAESHFRLNATSRTGAQGLGQLMPGTAAGLGVDDAYDPVQNIYGSARYIRSMLDRVTGKSDWNDLTWNDLGLALAAYNAGPGAVKKHGGIPPYRETQAYVKRVTEIYRKLCGGG